MNQSKTDRKEINKKIDIIGQATKKLDMKLPNFTKIPKKQIIYIVISIFALILLICIMNYDKIGLVINKYITDDNVVQIDLISSNNNIYEYQNEVLICNSEGLTSYNKYGKKTWELELKGAVDDYINTSGAYIQIINKDKSLIYIYKDKYEAARIKIEGTILSGSVNEKGYSVIEYTSTGNKTILALYDNRGNLEYNVKLSNNIIGQYILSNDSRYLAYIDVNIKGISVASSVMLVKLNKEATVEEMYTQDNSLIYDLTFCGNNLVYKLDEEIIVQSLSSKSKKESTIANESVVSIDIDDKKYAYIIFENGKYFLSVKSIGGNGTKNIEIKEIPKYFVYQDGNIFVCYQKKMCVYNSLKMKIKEYDSQMVITEPIVFGNGRNVAFLVSNKLIMFSI